jgi:hypothetical protein
MYNNHWLCVFLRLELSFRFSQVMPHTNPYSGTYDYCIAIVFFHTYRNEYNCSVEAEAQQIFIAVFTLVFTFSLTSDIFNLGSKFSQFKVGRTISFFRESRRMAVSNKALPPKL